MGYSPHTYSTSTYDTLITITGYFGNVNQDWEMKYLGESFSRTCCIEYQELQEYLANIGALVEARHSLVLIAICPLTYGYRRHILAT